MRFVLMLCCAALAAAIAGCAKPDAQGDLWIKGLALPPGSTVVERKEDQGTTPDKDHPGRQISVKSLNITFNNAIDWPAVYDYFDKLLAGLGYQNVMQGSYESMKALGEKHGSSGPPPPDYKKLALDMKSVSYVNGKEMVVTVMAFGQGADYVLHVARVK